MAAILKDIVLAIKVNMEEEKRVQYDIQRRNRKSSYFGLCV